MRRALREAVNRPQAECMIGDKALALSASCDLTQLSYQLLRNNVKDSAKTHILPSYRTVLAAKERYYPSPSAISFTDTSASVTPQAILDHTTARLAEAHNFLSPLDASADLQPGPSSSEAIRGLLEVKWGFDGATGQSVYKQAIREEDRPAE